MLGGMFLLASPARVHAHEGLDQQIAQLSQQLQARPQSADLLVRRGELHRLLREWEPAFLDLHAAARLEPDHATSDRTLAHLLADVGWHPAALCVIERHLARHPEDTDARKLRARELAAVGDLDAAAAEHDRRLAMLTRPQPDDYFARADLALASGDDGLPRAIAGLDEGLAVLGPVPSLLLRAMDLELRAGRIDAALGRLDQLAAASQRQETWLARRGDVLAAAGRTADAARAYGEALVALGRLRPRHRSTAAMVELERHVQQALGSLSGNDIADSPRPGTTTR